MKGVDLQHEMKRRRLRQADVAAKMGLSHSALSRYLTGIDPEWPEGFAEKVMQAIGDTSQDYVRRLLGEDADALSSNVAA